MATGTIQMPHVEIGTVTLNSGVTLQPWGSTSIAKFGHLVIFSFGGVRFSAAHSTEFGAFSVPWRAVTKVYTTESKDGSFVLFIGENSATIKVNVVQTGISYYGMLIYFTND